MAVKVIHTNKSCKIFHSEVLSKFCLSKMYVTYSILLHTQKAITQKVVSTVVSQDKCSVYVREGVWMGVFSVSLDLPSPLIVFGWTTTILQKKALYGRNTLDCRKTSKKNAKPYNRDYSKFTITRLILPYFINENFNSGTQWREKNLSFRWKNTRKFNDCFLGKTSSAKNLQMLFRGVGVSGWGGLQPFYKTYVPQVKNNLCMAIGPIF